MSKGQSLSIFEANIRAACSRFHLRAGEVDGVDSNMPFDELLRAEDDGLPDDAERGEEEFAQRRAAVRAFFRFLAADGVDPLVVMKRLYAVGRGLGIPPFSELTMTEAALMFSETKAAHSWRVKKLSGLIEQQGMKGSQLPGQKSKSATASYAAAQKGNQNRKGGKSARRKKAI